MFNSSKLLFFLALISCLSIGACGSPGVAEGKKSLEGNWEVYEVYYASGTRSSLGVSTDTTFTTTGNLGQFDFDESQVDYSYSYNNQSITDQSSWNLLQSTINCGFTNCEVYTLELEGLFLDCSFGDETADAEKDATMIKLAYETTVVGNYERYVLSLRK